MKYVALLRGINVGGNNIIKMIHLKEVIEKSGFSHVKTYIQSGNILFESDEKDISKITKKLEDVTSKAFNYTSRIVVRSHEQLKEILAHVPSAWKKSDTFRCYVAFVKEPITAETIYKEIDLRDEVDFVEISTGVVYMSTVLSHITKSKLSKLAGKKFYKDITIRNYNTTKKLLELMESQ